MLLLGRPTSHISMRQFWPISTNVYAAFSCKLYPYCQTEYQAFVDDVVVVVVRSTYLSCLRVTAFGRNLTAHPSTFGGMLFEHCTPVNK